MAAKRARRRIALLDELRGLAIVLMVFFHAFYLIGYTFNVELCRTLFAFFYPAQPWFAALFIFLCGLSCNLSHNNFKRGLLLAGVSALLSAVMWCVVFWRVLTPDNYIWFGVLHLLSVCILLFSLLRPTLKHVPAWLGLPICVALLVLCWHVPAEWGGYFGIRGVFTLAVPPASQDHPLLYALGLCPVSLCGDYFPLLPWGFCFFAGTFAGRWHFPKWSYRNRFPWFAAIGRHSLWVYLLHQPVLYVLCELVAWLIKRVF